MCAEKIKQSLYKKWYKDINKKEPKEVLSSDTSLNELISEAVNLVAFGKRHPLLFGGIFPLLVLTVLDEVFVLYQYGDNPTNIAAEKLVSYEPSKDIDTAEIAPNVWTIKYFDADGMIFRHFLQKLKHPSYV
jgi:hypothetical protein